jgi:hypothetical protein
VQPGRTITTVQDSQADTKRNHDNCVPSFVLSSFRPDYLFPLRYLPSSRNVPVGLGGNVTIDHIQQVQFPPCCLRVSHFTHSMQHHSSISARNVPLIRPSLSFNKLPHSYYIPESTAPSSLHQYRHIAPPPPTTRSLHVPAPSIGRLRSCTRLDALS